MRLKKYALTIWLTGLVYISLTACSAKPEADSAPRLLQESTLVSLLDPSATLPAETLISTPQAAQVSERFPVIHVTQPAQFILVTPTLPPSKTPSPVASPPTISETLSTSPEVTPTQTFGAITTPAVTHGASSAVVNCSVPWAFAAPPVGCPGGTSTTHFGVYQSFEKHGYSSYMLWIEPKTVYVLYGDGQSPHWREYLDTFVEGLDPVDEPGLDYPPEHAPERPSMDRWQPRRGFGKLWRDNVTPLDIMARIGWADIRYEIPYTMIVQQGQDGRRYMSDPYGRVFGLSSSGGQWTLTGYPAAVQSPVPGQMPTYSSLIPLPPSNN